MDTPCPDCNGTDFITDVVESKLEVICNDCGAIVRDTPSFAERSESNHGLTAGSPVHDPIFTEERSVSDNENDDDEEVDGDLSADVSDRTNDGPVCRMCTGRNVVLDTIGDSEQLVCRDCGYFAEETQLVSGTEYTNIPGKGTAVYGWSSAPKPKFARDKHFTPRGKLSGIQVVRDVCFQLKMRSELQEQAVKLFENLYARDGVISLQNSKKGTLAACCAYFVARENNVQVTLKTLMKIHPLHVKFINKCLRLIKTVTEKPMPAPRVGSLVSHVLSAYNFDPAFQDKVSKLSAILEDAYFAQGRDYTNLIISLAYLVWMSEDVVNRKTHFNDFCQQFGIKHSKNLQTSIPVIRKLLMTLANELPWLKGKVTKSTVLFHLGDILKFNRSVLSKAAKSAETSAGDETLATNRPWLTFTKAQLSRRPPVLNVDVILPDNIQRSELDKEELGDREFEDEMPLYLLTAEEVKLKGEILKLKAADVRTVQTDLVSEHPVGDVNLYVTDL